VMPEWRLRAVDGAAVEVRVLEVYGVEELRFTWRPQPPAAPPFDIGVLELARCPGEAAIPVRYGRVPSGTGIYDSITDPHYRLDRHGELVRRFVDALSDALLLGVCRTEATHRLAFARRELGEEKHNASLHNFSVADVSVHEPLLRRLRLEQAALEIGDHATRRVALTLIPTWKGPVEGLAVAAEAIMR